MRSCWHRNSQARPDSHITWRKVDADALIRIVQEIQIYSHSFGPLSTRHAAGGDPSIRPALLQPHVCYSLKTKGFADSRSQSAPLHACGNVQQDYRVDARCLWLKQSPQLRDAAIPHRNVRLHGRCGTAVAPHVSRVQCWYSSTAAIAFTRRPKTALAGPLRWTCDGMAVRTMTTPSESHIVLAFVAVRSLATLANHGRYAMLNRRLNPPHKGPGTDRCRLSGF